MISKLRRKFVVILMGVVTLILLAVFVSMLLSSAGNARRMSEARLVQALETFHPPNAAVPRFFEESPEAEGPFRGGAGASAFPAAPRMSVAVAAAGAGGEITVITNQLFYADDDTVRAIARKALAESGKTGVLNDEGIRWMKSGDEGLVALTDITMEQEMLRSLVINALLIGVAALAVFLFISLFLAHWAVRPVELAWQRQRQFVADASHELKTPLTVILSNADMLRGESLAEGKNSRRIEHIQAEALQMKKLVEDMLTLARSDSAARPNTRERVDFSDIVTNVVLTFEPVIYDEGKRISCDIKDGLLVAGDINALRKPVQILLDNALKYTPPGGLIEVRLAHGENRTVRLSVKNEGAAIPKEELEHIFQRFYRVEKSRSSPGSFGLGLSIAESIVRAHGGRIWAESGDFTGNSFFVSLPRELE